jgi:hypothetical protein
MGKIYFTFIRVILLIRVVWSGKMCEFQHERGLKPEMLTPIERIHITYQDIWTMFDPGSRALKIAIFSQKTLFICNTYLEISKNCRIGAAAIKKGSSGPY